jgi:DNA-binding PadR family transcriptional regulator
MGGIGHTHPAIKGSNCLFLLWVVGKHEAHGYRMIKLLKENGINIGANRLYPVLNRMLQEGLISQKEKKYDGRVRKVYVITAKGRKEIAKGKKLFRGIIGDFMKEMLE